MTTDSESPSPHGSSDDPDTTIKAERNGNDAPSSKLRSSDSTRLIQIANIAPQTTKEQMQALFTLVGKIEDIRLYPTVDLGYQVTSKICFVKFQDSASVSTAQHLTNTVFIDRALVVIPLMEIDIPDEQRGLELLTSGTLLPGIADPKLPQHVTSQLEGYPPHQVVGTYDPKLVEARLPMYPPLPSHTDARKIEEIRRTVLVANIPSEVTSQFVLDFFNQFGEVKYLRLCTRDNDPLRYALIEFTEQPSVLEALKQNGVTLGSKAIKVYHATQSIVKPQAKTNEAAQKEIEDAMSRQAQTIISQGIDSKPAVPTTPHLGAPVIKEKRRSRSRNRSRDRYSGSRSSRHRSRSSSRRRSSYRHRSRSRDKVSRRRSRSREHRDRDRRRSYSRSRSRSRRSRSRSSRNDDKKSSSSKKHKDRKRDRDKDEKREKDRDRKDTDKKDRDKGQRDKRDERSAKDTKKDKTSRQKENAEETGDGRPRSTREDSSEPMDTTENSDKDREVSQNGKN